MEIGHVHNKALCLVTFIISSRYYENIQEKGVDVMRLKVKAFALTTFIVSGGLSVRR